MITVHSGSGGKSSVSRPDRVKVGCDDVLWHKREFDDPTFDHTPNQSKVEHIAFFCVFKSERHFAEGMNDVIMWLVSYLY